MISPYVRRRRLARELIALREEFGYSGDRIARAVSVGRQRISRLENGHVRPDLGEIMRILDLFAIDESRWTQIMLIARDAQERGWWEKRAETIGHRQALRANLEAGSRSVREYRMTLWPEPFQSGEFADYRVRADQEMGYQTCVPELAVEARAMRQRLLDRTDGPAYEVIVDELALRRAGCLMT